MSKSVSKSSKFNKFNSKSNKKRHSFSGGVKGSANLKEANIKSKTLNELENKSSRIVMGIHSVKELFKVRKKSVVKMYLRTDWSRSSELLEIQKLAEANGVKIDEVGVEKLNQFGNSNQGVVVISNESPEFNLQKILSQKSVTIIALDGVEDPHNLGAILRTSWLMGVSAIIIPEDRAVGLVSTVNKVACGGAEYVPVYKVGGFSQIISQLKEKGFWVYGLSTDAKDELYQTVFPDKKVIFFGAEDKGMRTTTENLCDTLLKIPQKDNAASYNVSVSVAICLSESFRQHYTKN